MLQSQVVVFLHIAVIIQSIAISGDHWLTGTCLEKHDVRIGFFLKCSETDYCSYRKFGTEPFAVKGRFEYVQPFEYPALILFGTSVLCGWLAAGLTVMTFYVEYCGSMRCCRFVAGYAFVFHFVSSLLSVLGLVTFSALWTANKEFVPYYCGGRPHRTDPHQLNGPNRDYDFAVTGTVMLFVSCFLHALGIVPFWFMTENHRLRHLRPKSNSGGHSADKMKEGKALKYDESVVVHF